MGFRAFVGDQAVSHIMQDLYDIAVRAEEMHPHPSRNLFRPLVVAARTCGSFSSRIRSWPSRGTRRVHPASRKSHKFERAILPVRASAANTAGEVRKGSPASGSNKDWFPLGLHGRL